MICRNQSISCISYEALARLWQLLHKFQVKWSNFIHEGQGHIFNLRTWNQLAVELGQMLTTSHWYRN